MGLLSLEISEKGKVKGVWIRIKAHPNPCGFLKRLQIKPHQQLLFGCGKGRFAQNWPKFAIFSGIFKFGWIM